MLSREATSVEQISQTRKGRTRTTKAISAMALFFHPAVGRTTGAGVASAIVHRLPWPEIRRGRAEVLRRGPRDVRPFAASSQGKQGSFMSSWSPPPLLDLGAPPFRLQPTPLRSA